MLLTLPWALVGSIQLQVSFAKEPYKREYILQKRSVILRDHFKWSLLGAAKWVACALVGSIQLQVSFAKEPYKREYILQKRPEQEQMRLTGVRADSRGTPTRQCNSTCCSTLQHTATHCNTLSTLQHTAAHCNTLQHTATHCSTLQHTAAYCSTLQHTAAHCNTLQHTATNCARADSRKQQIM